MRIITHHYQDNNEDEYLQNKIIDLDNEFNNIQELIKNKKKFLLDKQKKLLIIAKNNEFLDNIKEDYSKYYNYIIQQKQEQIKALGVLNEYVKDLTEYGNLTEFNIEDAYEEQKNIMDEINNIKYNLDEIISNTNNTN